MERARSEWLRSLGFEQDLLLTRENVIFVVRSAHIEYLKPARFNDMLSVTVVVEQSGPASITFKQQVRRFLAATSPHASHDHESLLYCTGRVKIAALDSSTLRVCPIPRSMRTKISVGDIS